MPPDIRADAPKKRAALNARKKPRAGLSTSPPLKRSARPRCIALPSSRNDAVDSAWFRGVRPPVLYRLAPLPGMTRWIRPGSGASARPCCIAWPLSRNAVRPSKKTGSAGFSGTKTPESPGYFFKTESIDWQSALLRYIVKDTAIFSERAVHDDKNTECRPAPPAPDLSLRTANHDHLG